MAEAAELALFDAIEEYVARATEPLQREIAALRAGLDAIPPRVPGGDVDYAKVGEIVRATVGASFTALQAEAEPGPPGKDAEVDYDHVGEVIALAVEKAVANIPRPAEGAPGKDADPVDYVRIAEMVKATVGAVFAALPPTEPGKPGKDAVVDYDHVGEIVALAVDKAFANAPKPEPGTPGKDAVVDYTIIREFTTAAAINAVAALPKPEPGKDADAEAITAKVMAEVTARFNALPKPEDGKSVDPEEMRREVAREVAARVAELPKPEPGAPGKSVEVSEVKAMVEDAVADRFEALPSTMDADAVREYIDVRVKDMQPDEGALVARLLAKVPAPVPGKDAQPVDEVALVSRVLALVPAPEPGKPGESVHPDTVALMVRDEVAKAFEAMPKPEDGKPGRDALDTEIIESIDPTKSYPAGTFALHDGGTVLAFRDTDPIEGDLEAAGWKVTQDGIKEVVREDCEDERMTRVVVRSTSGKRFAVDCVTATGVKDQGVYRPGMKYRAGDAVTFDESYWIAKRDTQKCPPGEDWRLILKGKRRA